MGHSHSFDCGALVALSRWFEPFPHFVLVCIPKGTGGDRKANETGRRAKYCSAHISCGNLQVKHFVQPADRRTLPPVHCLYRRNCAVRARTAPFAPPQADSCLRYALVRHRTEMRAVASLPCCFLRVREDCFFRRCIWFVPITVDMISCFCALLVTCAAPVVSLREPSGTLSRFIPSLRGIN